MTCGSPEADRALPVMFVLAVVCEEVEEDCVLELEFLRATAEEDGSVPPNPCKTYAPTLAEEVNVKVEVAVKTARTMVVFA